MIIPVGTRVRSTWDKSLTGVVVGTGIIQEWPSGIEAVPGSHACYLVRLDVRFDQGDKSLPFRSVAVVVMRHDRVEVVT